VIKNEMNITVGATLFCVALQQNISGISLPAEVINK
jgi:hypothetical protein